MTGWQGPRVIESRTARCYGATETPTNVYLLMVEFTSYEHGMENSSRPETGEFAALLAND